MIVKIYLAFYDMLFEIYGALARHYRVKMAKKPEKRARYERKFRKCIEIREDILEVMFELRELEK